jgi:hypothetical protein
VAFKEGWREDRFDIETGRIDGGGYTTPGDVYPSREAYEEKVLNDQCWEHLKKLTMCECGSYMQPTGEMLTSNPPQQRYRCNDCGRTKNKAVAVAHGS